MRILIGFSYNGSNYSGFQRQNNAKTIQQTIEDAFMKKLGQNIELTATGRTDAGVHALCQYAHFDAEISFAPEKLVPIAKNILPSDIKVFFAKQVDETFNARKQVKKKTYMYVFNKEEKDLPFLENLTTFLEGDVDEQKMIQSSKKLIGTHNFKAFCSAGSSVRDFERTIYDISIESTKSRLVFKVTGNGFLYNMVRIIVGTLIDIGKGIIMPENIDKMLETCDRAYGGRTAKPNGLYLYNIEY